MPDETVQRIAALARIALSPDMADTMRHDLNHILKLLDHLDQADTQGVQPMAHPLAVTQRLRDDTITESNVQPELARMAPSFQGDLFSVPAVLPSTSDS